MANDNKPLVTPHSDKAFEQIHRANQAMRVLVVSALVIMMGILIFAVVRLNQLYQTQANAAAAQQDEINSRAKSNRELLDKLTDNSRDTQYLICRIVTVQVEGRDIPDEITKICGPVLEDGASQSAGDNAGPESNDGPTSFLAPGSDRAATSRSQPAPGNIANNQNTQGQQNATPPGSSQNQQPPAIVQPGLVDTIQPALNTLTPVLCSGQQLLLNGCIIRP